MIKIIIGLITFASINSFAAGAISLACTGTQLTIDEEGKDIKELVTMKLVYASSSMGLFEVTDKGGTMRLGAWDCELKEGSLVKEAYLGTTDISERHRHRYEVNPEYHDILKKNGLSLSGMSPDRKLVEFIELVDHPYFIATQAHPEFKSRLEAPHPLFTGLVKAALKK